MGLYEINTRLLFPRLLRYPQASIPYLHQGTSSTVAVFRLYLMNSELVVVDLEVSTIMLESLQVETTKAISQQRPNGVKLCGGGIAITCRVATFGMRVMKALLSIDFCINLYLTT